MKRQADIDDFTACALTHNCVCMREETDHLGSSSFITDATGYAVQHLQYLPFGETFVDQTPATNPYDSRYTFSAKEKDNETQYSYFGARYYDSDLSVWLSVDPLADKCPNLSPYNYCGNNPIMFVDIDGNVFVTYIKIKQQNEAGKMQKMKYKVVFDGTNTTMQRISKGKLSDVKENYKEGTNKFVDNIIASYDYIVDAGADVDNAMQLIASAKEEILVVNSKLQGDYDNGVIRFDFNYGLKIDNIKEGEKGYQSPALGFWGESYHAFLDYFATDIKSTFKNSGQEENYVHGNKERTVIDALRTYYKGNSETKRTDYLDAIILFKADNIFDTEE